MVFLAQFQCPESQDCRSCVGKSDNAAGESRDKEKKLTFKNAAPAGLKANNKSLKKLQCQKISGRVKKNCFFFHTAM